MIAQPRLYRVKIKVVVLHCYSADSRYIYNFLQSKVQDLFPLRDVMMLVSRPVSDSQHPSCAREKEPGLATAVKITRVSSCLPFLRSSAVDLIVKQYLIRYAADVVAITSLEKPLL